MRKKLWKALCFGLYFLPLFGENEMKIESEEAAYQGNSVILNGNATVQHEIGRIRAQKMVLTPPEGEKKLRLGTGTLSMKEKVSLQLQEGGALSCGKAYLDFQTMQGTFEGDETQEFVIYMENCRDKSSPHQRLPLIVKSHRMVLHLDRANKEGAPKSYIKSIDAEEQVTVDYNHDFIAASDFATYQRVSHPDSSKSSLTGLILLSAKGPEGLCQVINRNGDLITASQMAIDTIKHQILMNQPQGNFIGERDRNAEKINFKAENLLWDDKASTIRLLKNVSLEQLGIGKVTTEEELKIAQGVINGKKQIQSVESTGKTILTRGEESEDEKQILTCFGKLFIDHIHLSILLESPLNEMGGINEESQVAFEDIHGKIFADKVTVSYGLIDRKIALQKIFLEGHIRMVNSRTPSPQYVLADTAEFFPITKEMTFKGSSGKRVLFYDKARELQVSAPGLRIKRGESEGKDSIKGIGDVRFSFIEHEFEELRKKFSLSRQTD